MRLKNCCMSSSSFSVAVRTDISLCNALRCKAYTARLQDCWLRGRGMTLYATEGNMEYSAQSPICFIYHFTYDKMRQKRDVVSRRWYRDQSIRVRWIGLKSCTQNVHHEAFVKVFVDGLQFNQKCIPNTIVCYSCVRIVHGRSPSPRLHCLSNVWCVRNVR